MAILFFVILYAICLTDPVTPQQGSGFVGKEKSAPAETASSDFSPNNGSVDPFYAKGYRIGYKKGYDLGYSQGYAYGYERFGGEYQNSSFSGNQSDCQANGTCANEGETKSTEESTSASGNTSGETPLSGKGTSLKKRRSLNRSKN